MPNRTIYVKDEALWDRAKELAGGDGLSALIGQALEEFVQRKKMEKVGFSRQTIFVHAGLGSPDDHLVRFDGRSLGHAVLGRGRGRPEDIAEVFQTKAGKLVLVIYSDENSDEADEYRTYETLKELEADSDVFSAIPPKARAEFLQSVADALGQKWSVWID